MRAYGLAVSLRSSVTVIDQIERMTETLRMAWRYRDRVAHNWLATSRTWPIAPSPGRQNGSWPVLTKMQASSLYMRGKRPGVPGRLLSGRFLIAARKSSQ